MLGPFVSIIKHVRIQVIVMMSVSVAFLGEPLCHAVVSMLMLDQELYRPATLQILNNPRLSPS